jgi:hypothetical protein
MSCKGLKQLGATISLRHSNNSHARAVRLCAAGEGTTARYRRHQGSLNVEGTTAAIGRRPAGMARASVFGARAVGSSPPFRPQNCGALDQTLPATGIIPNYSDFTTGSAFKATDQRGSRTNLRSAARLATVADIDRGPAPAGVLFPMPPKNSAILSLC